MRSSVALFLASLAALAACATEPNDSPGVVAIIYDRPAYAAGDVATVTVKNLSTVKMHYTACSPKVQQLIDGEYRTVNQSRLPCTAQLEFLNAFESRTTAVALPGFLRNGTYRVRFPSIGKISIEGEIFQAAGQVGGKFEVR